MINYTANFRTFDHWIRWFRSFFVLFLMLPLVRDLPITIPETLFLKASLGVTTLIWSFELSPGNLIPGVIINNFLIFFLTIFASWAEQTMPSQFDFFIRSACFKTNCFTLFVWPICFRDFSFRLVKIVTPNILNLYLFFCFSLYRL